MSFARNAISGAERREASTTEPSFDADEAIRGANSELARRVDGGLTLALSVLSEQRDRALREAASARAGATRGREELLQEQDRFIADLMLDHERQVDELQRQLVRARADLQRRLVLTPALPIISAGAGPELKKLQAAVTASEQKIVSLQQLLHAAYAETDETHADATRLQEERDEAIRQIDDVRLQHFQELDAARGEGAELQWKLDECNRLLEDARDEARDEAYRLVEELDTVRRELDERNQEARHLRERLSELDATNSRPPPSDHELQGARREAQFLRKQLIDAKREQSRLMRDLERARMRPSPHSGGEPTPAEPRSQIHPTFDPSRRATPAGGFSASR